MKFNHSIQNPNRLKTAKTQSEDVLLRSAGQGEKRDRYGFRVGITGGKGRCYDFWIDFSGCVSNAKEPKDCALLREDYFECLHHGKEYSRRNAVYKEKQRQLREAARKDKEGTAGEHHT